MIALGDPAFSSPALRARRRGGAGTGGTGLSGPTPTSTYLYMYVYLTNVSRGKHVYPTLRPPKIWADNQQNEAWGWLCNLLITSLVKSKKNRPLRGRFYISKKKIRIMNTYFWNSKKRHMHLSFVVLLDIEPKSAPHLRGRFFFYIFLPNSKFQIPFFWGFQHRILDSY